MSPVKKPKYNPSFKSSPNEALLDRFRKIKIELQNLIKEVKDRQSLWADAPDNIREHLQLEYLDALVEEINHGN